MVLCSRPQQPIHALCLHTNLYPTFTQRCQQQRSTQSSGRLGALYSLLDPTYREEVAIQYGAAVDYAARFGAYNFSGVGIR